VKGQTNQQNRRAIMKTKLTESKFKYGRGVSGQLFSRITYLGAVILIWSSASAQNLFVSGNARASKTADRHAA
jgi:hypothetical protein